jgi:hypothetical protein
MGHKKPLLLDRVICLTNTKDHSANGLPTAIRYKTIVPEESAGRKGPGPYFKIIVNHGNFRDSLELLQVQGSR